MSILSHQLVVVAITFVSLFAGVGFEIGFLSLESPWNIVAAGFFALTVAGLFHRFTPAKCPNPECKKNRTYSTEFVLGYAPRSYRCAACGKEYYLYKFKIHEAKNLHPKEN
jgi:hypothetical protein